MSGPTTARTLFVVIVLLMTAFVSLTPAGAQDLQRGLKNYQLIISGQKRLDQFTPEEQQEVLRVVQMLRKSEPPSDSSDECKNAWSEAGSAASDLSSYARRLQSCADSGDYHDDCDSEFRRVKSTYDDYESAVSSVGYDCH